MSKTDKPVFELHQKSEEDSHSKIETIKKLIFGEQIQLYDAELKNLKMDMITKSTAIGKQLDEVNEEMSTALDNFATDINLRITELEKKIEEIEAMATQAIDREELGKLMVDFGQRISKK